MKFFRTCLVSLFLISIPKLVFSQKLKEIVLIENNLDTSFCFMQKLKGEQKKQYQDFDGIVVNCSGKERALTAKDIAGYKLKDKQYRSIALPIEGMEEQTFLGAFAEIKL